MNYLQWTGDWKPDNAKEMFDYIKEQKMEHLFYGFELGNEVWGILTGDAHFDAEQAARDYKTFRELIDDSFGPGQKKLLTLSGNWESFFMERFTQERFLIESGPKWTVKMGESRRSRKNGRSVQKWWVSSRFGQLFARGPGR